MIFRSLTVSLFLAFLNLNAAGQISSEVLARYNAAVQSDDTAEKLSAAEVLAQEAVASPKDSDAALLAYEAAWTMCSNGDCTKALPAAEFAVSQPATGGHPLMADRNLLLAYAAWQAAPGGQTRASLDSALDAVLTEPPSLLSVSAFHNRYIEDMSEAEFELAEKTASATAEHLYPVRSQVGRIWSGAAISAEIAAFNDRHPPEALIGMATVKAELAMMLHMTPDAPGWLKERYYTSLAWTNAMDAYFQSEGQAEDARERVDQIRADAITDDNHEHPPGPSIHDSDGLPSCDGKLNRPPKPSYPNKAARRGYVGAVIALFDVDEEGKITARIGASVPGDLFDEEVLESLERRKWIWEDNRDGDPACQKSLKDTVHPFVFILEG